MNCPICGKFMSRLGLIAQVRIEVSGGGKRTHICSEEQYTYATNTWIHDKAEIARQEAEDLQRIEKELKQKYGVADG